MSETKSVDQFLERWALPPEFDEAGKNHMRDKAKRQLPAHDAFGTMSDEWVADRVRMLMRDDIYHEPICTAGRDRIMRLSLDNSQLRDELKQAQGIAANRNIAIADLAQENEQLKDQIAQQSSSVKSWRAKFFEMEARAIAAVYLVPEDKVCGELRTLRDRARVILETHRRESTT